MRILDVITSGRWRVCWATTFSFEPAFFEAFVARRLGEPPLNITVLADAERLDAAWAQVGEHDRWRVSGANRRYLVRGVQLSGGAFHPKTILLGNRRAGVLLVGSGNLTHSGLDTGHEVYTELRSTDEPGAFGDWRDWMTSIVSRLDDPEVRARWSDARAQLPWLGGAGAGSSSFLSNERVTMLDRLSGSVTAPIDELLVTAPFFDSDLGALRALIDRTRPRSLSIYLTPGASVEGARLAALVEESSVPCTVHRYGSERRIPYVHAKVIVAVRGERALVLAGSPNLSAPALLSSVSGPPTGNSEAAVLREMGADEARALIVGVPRLTTTVIGAPDLQAFTRMPFPAAESHAVRLRSAVPVADGVRVRTDRPPPGGASLTDGAQRTAIDGDIAAGFTADETGALVWLVDAAGKPLSNRVPLDDPASLARMLRAVEAGEGGDRPRELDALDREHPLARMLLELHQAAVFDVDDTPAHRHVEEGRGEGAASAEDDAFWDRYFQEELGRDPRAAAYRGWSVTAVDALATDAFGALLLSMLHRVPAPFELVLLDGTVTSKDADAATEGHGTRWTTSQRLRQRAFNVLYRWCGGLADPRIRWFGEHAAVRNYVGLLTILVRCWPQSRMTSDADQWLRTDQLRRLAARLFGTFIRPETGRGYLVDVPDEQRESAIRFLVQQGATASAAAVAYAALQRADREEMFAWQAFLVPGLTMGVFESNGDAAVLASAMVGSTVTAADVAARLRTVADYIDDERWCLDTAARLGLPKLVLRASGNPYYPRELAMEGAIDLLRDPRTVALASAALSYLHIKGIRLVSRADVVVVDPGRNLAARIGGAFHESFQPVTPQQLDELAARGGALIDLIDRAEAAAS